MSRSSVLILFILGFILVGCKEEKNKFPIDKRYWDTTDYYRVLLKLNYGYKSDEKLPSFSDPNTRVIVEKLTDKQNYKVILEDEELGLKYRNEVASEFFKHWRDMSSTYTATDRQDKYIYEDEHLAVWHFGLDLQLKYFELGNIEIQESSDDPNSKSTLYTIKDNVEVLISNFMIYIDEVNNEKSYSKSGLSKLAKGIDVYFFKLIDLYPKADYKILENKIELLLKKVKSDTVKKSLQKLLDKINSKNS